MTGIIHSASESSREAELNRQIRESEYHYRQMADLMPDKVSTHDLQGNTIYLNKAWRDFSGLSMEEMVGRDSGSIIHPEDYPQLREKWQHTLETGAEYEMEYRIKNKEGAYIWQLARAVPIRDESGTISSWLTTSTDIQKLKEEEQRKDSFLKMVSHELKTPLTSIKGYVHLLQTLAERYKDQLPASMPIGTSLDRIETQLNRLTRLISNFLDLSRLETERLDLGSEKFSMNTLVDETVQDIHFTNPRQKVRVLHHCQCEVTGDKDRIGQVLINFITNAIKYSPGGSEVQVEVSKTPEGLLAVSVADQGIGIEEKDLEKIFERFYRTRRATVDTYAGFGIGLYLAKEIVERHQGHIRVESTPGEGSMFTFYLPCL